VIAAELLAIHPFTRELSAAQRAALLPLARLVQLPGGQFVFREGAAADMLYLLHEGRVSLEQHVPARGELQLEELGPGDLLGLSWAWSSGRWLLDARVKEAITALALDATDLRALMHRDPELGFALAMQLARQLYVRLERVRLQRLDVYGSRP
jgi:CRP-like cAMP-binding protein